jgi:chitinase
MGRAARRFVLAGAAASLAVLAATLQGCGPGHGDQAREAEAPEPPPVAIVFGNYVGYDRAMPPEAIPWDRITHLGHFAATPRPDATLDMVFLGLTDEKIRALMAARPARVKVLLVVGGANSLHGFQAAMAHDFDAFVGNIVGTVDRYGYDGVDIDWEQLRIRERDAFERLVQALRARLPKGKLLTIDVPDHGRGNPVSAMVAGKGVLPFVDLVNVMSYALAAPGYTPRVWHNAALEDAGTGLPSVDDAIAKYLDAGVPRQKLLMGVQFAGKIWHGGAGMREGGATQPAQTWQTRPSISKEILYRDLVRRPEVANARRWDAEAGVPFASTNAEGDGGDSFLTYDDEESIRLKGAFARRQGLGGVMIWHLASDYFRDRPPGRRNPLLAALLEGLADASAKAP